MLKINAKKKHKVKSICFVTIQLSLSGIYLFSQMTAFAFVRNVLNAIHSYETNYNSTLAYFLCGY